MRSGLISLFLGVAISALGTASAMAQTAPATPQGAGDGGFGDIIVTAQRRAERAQDVPIVISAFSSEQLQRTNVTQPQDLYGTVPSLVSGNNGQASRDVQSYTIRGQATGFLASPGVQTYLNEVPLPASISLSLQGGPGLFIDPENVQILSGPQGTLFGRNTTGGAVLFQAKKPTNDFEGYVEGSVGNLDLRGAEGTINVPIVDDRLMVRVAAAYHDRRGFTRDIVFDKWRDDEHWYTGRVGILLKPTERISNYLLAYGSKSSTNGTSFINGGFNIPNLVAAGACVEGPGTAAAASCAVYRRQAEIQQQLGPRRTRGDVDGYSKIDSWGLINITDIELDDRFTLRNIASYQELKDDYAADTDGTPLQVAELTQNGRLPDFPIPGLADEFGLPATPGNAFLNGTAPFGLPRDNIKQVTEELQLQGNLLDNHLNFAVGGFYFNATPASKWGSNAVQFCNAASTGKPFTDPAACGPTPSVSGVSNKSRAVYAQGTLNLGALAPSLEGLRLTGGARYTWDTIKGFGGSWVPIGASFIYDSNRVPSGQIGNFCIFGPTSVFGFKPASIDPQVACRYSSTLKSNKPTWTLGLDYKPLRDVLVYAKISRGYKSGGFNTFSVRPETQTFAPEFLTSYEGGFKSDFLLGTARAHLNATYFYSNYKGIQRPSGDTNGPAAGAAIFSADATIQGVEVDASLRPVRGVEIGGTFSYTRGRYSDFILPSTNAPRPVCGPNGSQVIVPVNGIPVDYSCAPFQFVTPYIYNIYTNISIPVPESVGEASLYVNYSHVSHQYVQPDPFEPGADLEPYGLLGASLTISGVAGTGLDLTVFGRNLTNKTYRIGNSGVWYSANYQSSPYGEPRTYGLRVRYRFGS